LFSLAPTQDAEASAPGHDDVENDQIGGDRGGEAERLIAVSGLHDAVTERANALARSPKLPTRPLIGRAAH
jgi:hypothetical protein